jgi:LemA protein
MVYMATVGVLVILVFWIVSVQRSFIALDENINNAMLQINMQISSCWDMLTSLLDLTRRYVAEDYNALTDTLKSRRSLTKHSSIEDIKNQEIKINEFMEKVIAIAEANQDLKENQAFIKIMSSVNQYENMVRASRLIYNNSVKKLNRVVSMFPASLIAGMLGFSKRAYLETDD